ncbi:glutathione S-transferase family protein [Marinivivus vitaminiproducens]|uniref:glutathione S-transferase family protein n=1 Tax=Marinivivus vitaminiproducens TaxID=3035935 RepID=UPI00279A4BF9|nr:glutathione S-transferase family protein [Geminicoccaceae bacterium SCSIO 64248]
MLLHHYPLDPFSRKLRIGLAEKGIACELVDVLPWEREDAFLEVSPAAETPVLDDRGVLVPDSMAALEYLEETQTARPLLGRSPVERAETRRLIGWFDVKFVREVTDLLWREKLLKRVKRTTVPNSEAVRAGLVNIHAHLDYISYLFERRNWLAGDALTWADCAAAAQLSVIDYLGDVPWDKHPGAKEWYARIKSRPSFRPLLRDRVVGLKPADHYDDLDF